MPNALALMRPSRAVAMFALARAVEAWDPVKHPRIPKGLPDAGQFLTLDERMQVAFHGGGNDPLKGFSRPSLLKAAKDRGIYVRRGASEEELRSALEKDIKAKGVSEKAKRLSDALKKGDVPEGRGLIAKAAARTAAGPGKLGKQGLIGGEPDPDAALAKFREGRVARLVASFEGDSYHPNVVAVMSGDDPHGRWSAGDHSPEANKARATELRRMARGARDLAGMRLANSPGHRPGDNVRRKLAEDAIQRAENLDDLADALDPPAHLKAVTAKKPAAKKAAFNAEVSAAMVGRHGSDEAAIKAELDSLTLDQVKRVARELNVPGNGRDYRKQTYSGKRGDVIGYVADTVAGHHRRSGNRSKSPHEPGSPLAVSRGKTVGPWDRPDAPDDLAAELHDEWRKTRLSGGSYEPRMKATKDSKWAAAHGTDQVDIANTRFEDLPSDWQAENMAAAKVVVDLVRRRGTVDIRNDADRVEVGSAIHDEWLKRNEWAKGGELDVPFERLPRSEQDKDIAQYAAAARVFGNADARSNLAAMRSERDKYGRAGRPSGKPTPTPPTADEIAAGHAARRRAKAAKATPATAPEKAKLLKAAKTREEGQEILRGMTAVQLKDLARHLNIAADSRDNKSEITAKIVHGTVGIREDDAALRSWRTSGPKA